MTGPRQAILDLLRAQAHPQTIRQIHTALPDPCDLATVYRAMHMLESIGMVKRFDFGDGTARFELVGEGDDGHHHHLICRSCDQVIQLNHVYLENLGTEILEDYSFQSDIDHMAIFGLCNTCRGRKGSDVPII